ncbi:AAA family ATPase [Hydrogenophaga sp.]|uniref:ATP-binding protein n=1 Tax=Hydrogenophaga sp. TaxID=1904254 RepID=UPI00271A3344|nr:AAA family ATPase [Hydrogenophaga sp.]MDO8904031.1 AAA family ATPase [Hydrogenophaga sp.]
MTAAALQSPPDAPGHLRVTLLGGFAVSINGVEVPVERWSGLRATHLVQLLSLQPRHRATRDQVIDALWPQLEPDAGAANLRKALHHARQALRRHDSIEQQAGELVLWPQGTLAVDANEFEQRAHSALRHRDPAACADAAGAYAGTVLPGAQFEAWTEPARERLRARYLELLRASAQWAALAQQEPTDEGAHRALMQQALDSGNRAAALQWYGRLREALQQALGVLPDPQTEALYERCVAGLQATGPAFVGRSTELGRLAACLAAPAVERPGGLLLRGPPGMGKSALCREIAAMARQRGWQVLRVDAAQNSRAYAVVASITEHLVLGDRGLLDRIGHVARAVLTQISPLAAPADRLPGPLGRHQVVGAIRRLLLAAMGDDPLLLQIDDAHLIDDADADVLLQLAMAGAPLCVCLSTRPLATDSVLGRGVGRLQRAGVLEVFDLAPLTNEECRRLIDRAADPPLTDQLANRIVQMAQGHPFAAIELARCPNVGAEHALPSSAFEAITARLCDVPPSAQALLRWLALSGDECEAVFVEALASQAQVPALSALDDALAAGVLVMAGSCYRFRHELVRQALIGQLAPHHRMKMHRQIANELAECGAAPASVARHWLEGAQPKQALPWLLTAAQDAVRLAAFSDALRHLDQLLGLQPDHADALRLRAEALDARGDPAALFAYRLAATAASETESHNLLAKAALAQVKLGDPKGALLALEGVNPTSVEGRLCEALAYSGAAALGATDPAIGTAKSAVARRLALASGDTSALVVASWAQAAAAHARGELHRSVWADLQETRHVPHLALRVFDGHLCITQRFLYGARPYPEVIAFADALSTEAQRLGAARGHAFGTTLRGEAEWLAGDLMAARQHLEEGARLHRALGGAVGEALSLQRLAEVALQEKRQEEARDLIDQALDVARQTDIGFHLLDRIYGTRIQLHADDPDAALHVMEDASESVRGPLETCPGCRITFAVPAAIAAARAGEIDLAEQHETQCAYLAQVVMRLPAWYAAHDEVLGHIAAARKGRSHELATNHFAAAAQRFAAAGQPFDTARCEALSRGDPGRIS